MSENTLSFDWRKEHDYHAIQEYLHDFKGCSSKQKLLDDLCDFLYFKKVEWAYHHRVKFSPEVCLVVIKEPSTNEIIDIGGTIPGDLFTDNFGFILQNLIRTPVNAAETNNQCKDDAAAAFNSNWYSNGASSGIWVDQAAALGTQIKIGSGTTAPARGDTAIQTAFSTAPESGYFGTGNGSYSAGSGTITFSGSITAGNENGTINEAVASGVWANTVGGTKNIIICHDATTATAFSNAKSITVQYSWTD